MSVNYGRAIAAVRALRGIQQKALAADTGLKQNTISMIESGNRKPSPSTLEAIAKALRCPVWVLIYLGEKHDGKAIGAMAAEVLQALVAEVSR